MADRQSAPAFASSTTTARCSGPLRALAFLLGLALTVPVSAATTDQSSSDLIARGKYLSDAGDCAACHTNPGGQAFAGGRYLPTPFGPISTPNITSDRDTGIGAWTDDEFYRVFHDGVGRHGEYLYPAMPYPWYTKVTREDVLAIKAYLLSLAAGPRTAAAQQTGFSIQHPLGPAGLERSLLPPRDLPARREQVVRGQSRGLPRPRPWALRRVPQRPRAARRQRRFQAVARRPDPRLVRAEYHLRRARGHRQILG